MSGTLRLGLTRRARSDREKIFSGEFLSTENFGQVSEMYRKMYSKNVQRQKVNFFVLTNFGLGPVPLSSARRDEFNGTLFVRIGQTFGPPSDRIF